MFEQPWATLEFRTFCCWLEVTRFVRLEGLGNRQATSRPILWLCSALEEKKKKTVPQTSLEPVTVSYTTPEIFSKFTPPPTITPYANSHQILC
jgi:hypothetical protein